MLGKFLNKLGELRMVRKGEVNSMRRFEVAIKKRDELTGETLLWDVLPEDMPEYATRYAAGADFKAAKTVIIPSMWKLAVEALFKGGCRTARYAVGLFKNGYNVEYSDDMKEVVKELMSPTKVHTGIKVLMDNDEVLYVYNRSSGPKKLGIVMANSVGVIDSDYYSNKSTDGEIAFPYYNILPFDITIKKGSVIGQGVFHKVLRAENAKVGGERTGGFGSTDKRN